MNTYELTTIQEAFKGQMQSIAKECIVDLINDIPNYELKELCEKPLKDYVQELQDYIWNSHYHEYFQHLDIYYNQTKSRGDTGSVCEAFRDLLEDEGLEYLLQESTDFQELEGVRRANWLVNLTAEATCHGYIPEAFPSSQELELLIANKTTKKS